jgi:adenine-specific DNA-methyltransferase
MKYMGSKRAMLANGLGTVLRNEMSGMNRFADLFAGSCAVSWFVAENFPSCVVTTDLQRYSAVLADAVLGRTKSLDAKLIWKDWSASARLSVRKNSIYAQAVKFQKIKWARARRRSVAEARELCKASDGLITLAYGGHYFSPFQALVIDALRDNLPADPEPRNAALAALITATSRCAAAPGHTAQPFQPTRGAAKFLFEGWTRNVWRHAKSALAQICSRHAKVLGEGKVGTAEELAATLGPGDVAFLDPPYSGVHYSRFYHVLETVARGDCAEVSGVGRYPPPSERPKSDFSVATRSKQALERLLKILGQRGVRTILTFPKEKTSNGLSGSIVESVAEKYFEVKKVTTNGRFSTLGGNTPKRKARIPAYEIILSLSPRN